jgi:hypothetical protein
LVYQHQPLLPLITSLLQVVVAVAVEWVAAVVLVVLELAAVFLYL